MKLISSFLQLVRWQNLAFIVLTQVLFYICVYLPLFAHEDHSSFAWIVCASVLIAAAGYIINDYFDLNIDQINKPGKNVFNRTIHRRWAIIWHFLLSIAGIIATALAVGLSKWYLILANVGCVALLWLYSTSFKRRLLIGNVVIALLTAWTVLILFFTYTEPRQALTGGGTETLKFFRVAFLYGAFAFISSLIREAVKDMEDLEGDARYGCRTLPIVAGIRTTKIYISVWLVVLIASLIVLQLYVLQLGWWEAVLYSILLVILPLVILFTKLSRATAKKEFEVLSRICKIVMLTGTLSMVFFLFYF